MGKCVDCLQICRHFAADSSAATDVARRSPVGWLIACGALLVAAIIIGTAIMVGQFRERALTNAERELENTVLLLTRHFDQQLEDSGAITRNVISQMGIPSVRVGRHVQRARCLPIRRAPGAEIKTQRALRYRRAQYLRRRRQADQFVEPAGRCPPSMSPTALISRRSRRAADPAAVLFEPVRSMFTGEWTTSSPTG